MKLLFVALLLLPNQADEDPWDDFWRKDYTKAYAGLEKVARKSPYWVVPVDGMAWCRYYQGRHEEAEELFKKALELDAEYEFSKKGAELLRAWRWQILERAWALHAAGSYQEARNLFEQVIKDRTERLPKSEHWRATLGLGYCALGAGQYRNANQHFNVTLRLNSRCAKAREGMGYAYRAMGKTKQAIPQFLQALKLEPDELEARLAVAWCHVERRGWRDARKHFAEVVRYHPRESRGYLGLGYAAAQRKEYRKAFESYLEGLELSTASFYGKVREPVDEIARLHPLYSELARIYYEGTQYRLSLLEIDRAEAADLLDDRLRLLRAAAHYRLGEVERSQQELGKIEDEEQARLDLRLKTEEGQVEIALTPASLKAWIEYSEGNYAAARESFAKLAGDSQDPDHRCGLAWCLFSLGSFQAAQETFAAILEDHPGYPDAVTGQEAIHRVHRGSFDAAWASYEAGDATGALTTFDALRADPGLFPRDELWRLDEGRGWCLLALENVDKAIDAFEKARRSQPQEASVLHGIGQAYWSKGNTAKAIETLKILIEQHPEHVMGLVLLGKCYFETGEVREARGIFEKVLKKQPQHVGALAGMAWCHVGEKKLVDARRCFQKVIAQDPAAIDDGRFRELAGRHVELLALLGELGWARFAREDYQRALEVFELAQRLDSLDPSHGRGLGMCAYHLGDYSRAVRELATYVKELPESEIGWSDASQLLSTLGWSYYHTQQYRDGIKAFERLSELHGTQGGYSDPYDGMGWCSLQLGDLSAAERHFLESIRRTPRYESSLSGLEEVQRRKGGEG